jgi:23S rRNA (adenine2030-N6)-methyltransferase
MLAYRHAFHAGNHGDVLKHVVLVALLRHLNLKTKGWRCVDTHAGVGRYDLASAEAGKRGEFRHGIERLWPRDDLPAAVADYVALVRQDNPDGRLRTYPGSPWLAAALTRPQDELRLFERHPADHAALVHTMAGRRGVQIRPGDGFAGLKSQLPPPTRRGLVLIDPSYEGQADYAHVVVALEEALRRFADGVYMLWYPIVAKPGAAAMVRQVQALAPHGWLHASLRVQPLDAQGFGLAGSGVLVLRPPHPLSQALQTALPWLCTTLAQHDGAAWQLEHDLR